MISCNTEEEWISLSFIHSRQMICAKRDYYISHHAPQLLFLLYKDQMMHDTIALTKLNEYFAFSPCERRNTFGTRSNKVSCDFVLQKHESQK